MIDYAEAINILDSQDFAPLESSLNYITPDNQNYELCFIDGGNSEIITTPNISLQIIKTSAIIMKKNKLSEIKTKKSLFLIKSLEKSYEIIEIGKNKYELEINKNIQEIGNILRNLAELRLCKEMQKEFQGLIIKDGGFEVHTDIEKQELALLGPICGLSKTSMDLNQSKLHQKNGCWFFHQDTNYIVKLNKNSNYAFKLELKNLDIEQVIQALISNSKDFIYPGYPYGLILVDRFARISNQQILYLKTYLETKMGKKWEKIKFLENSLNAHNILDKLVF